MQPFTPTAGLPGHGYVEPPINLIELGPKLEQWKKHPFLFNGVSLGKCEMRREVSAPLAAPSY
jgi:hypothetical protein